MSASGIAACFEELPYGIWRCVKTVQIEGPVGDVVVQQGRCFNPHIAFAGYDDFTGLLEQLKRATDRLT